ncbi:Hint domain-containing protein [Acetobacter sp.]|uniref:Hint domain-containing protein n=1 Tax=Acetobacter sp. TaxID=440 RepID=UPI0025C3A246|nr:Hint domain-containing protein [Acetobacter sp.]MCH4091031.1 Hint domain-containing protein [Acetobacter sp.]MCI1300214.1 Hint domain-containing protein [Acetobacter sp.]MCI1316118.1 Hint domain-containing protein [Acetobacter sp.]
MDVTLANESLTSNVASATIESGGRLNISSGGVASSVTVMSGGLLFVGKQNDTSDAPGAQGVVSGGVVSAGGTLTVYGGGLVENVLVNSSNLLVSSDAVVSALTLASGVTETLYGVDSGATVQENADQSIQAGGSAVSATLQHGTQDIGQGGTAISTTVIGFGSGHGADGGGQNINAGGFASHTIVTNYATQLITSQASATDTILTNGGVQEIDGGGSATNTTVSSGGFLDVTEGGFISGATVSSGGTLSATEIDGSSTTVADVTVLSGGSIALTGVGVTVTGLTLQSGAGIQLLSLDDTTHSTTLSASGNTLTVSGYYNGSAVTQVFSFAGTAGTITAEDFSLAQDANGTTLNYAACYCSGTLIATKDGEVPVEQLKIGDMVRTASGTLKKIRWIGRRSYGAEFVSNNRGLMPVLIRAGALADNVPRRDLKVSPLHAMYLDGVLVAASALINGETVIQCDVKEQIEYFNIELDTHDLLMAEGAPSESYVEDGGRGMFHNAAEFYTLYPDAVATQAVHYAPRVEKGEEVVAIWQRINARAQALVSREVDMGQAETCLRLPPETQAEAGPVSPFDPADYRGGLDHASHDCVGGWIWNAKRPCEKARVDIRIDGQHVATLPAVNYRADLVPAGMGNGWSGFRMTLKEPLDWKTSHMIEVFYSGTDVQVPGSPAQLSVPEQFDGALRNVIGRAVKDMSSSTERRQALSFILEQAAHLRQKEADLDGQREKRTALHHERRLAGRDAADMPVMRRALVISETMPRIGHDPDAAPLLSHIRSLARLGYDVTVSTVDHAAVPETETLLEAEGVSITRAPLYASPEEVLRRQAGCFDLVYLRGLSAASSYAGLARRYMGRATVVYGTRELQYLRLERQAETEARVDLLRAIGRMRTYEITTALLCDQVIVHSQVEANRLKQLVPALNVHVVPWEVEPEAVEQPASTRSGVAFFGYYDRADSLDAAILLVREIMPLVWARRPDIRCLLAGPGQEKVVGTLAMPADSDCGGVEIVGGIDNPAKALFPQARAGVVPLNFGAGVDGVVLSAFAAGVPCVMSAVSAEGMVLPGRLTGLVQNSVEGIAEQLLRLHEEPETSDELGRTEMRLIREQFSTETVDRCLGEALGLKQASQPVVRMAG